MEVTQEQLILKGFSEQLRIVMKYKKNSLDYVLLSQ